MLSGDDCGGCWSGAWFGSNWVDAFLPKSTTAASELSCLPVLQTTVTHVLEAYEQASSGAEGGESQGALYVLAAHIDIVQRAFQNLFDDNVLDVTNPEWAENERDCLFRPLGLYQCDNQHITSNQNIDDLYCQFEKVLDWGKVGFSKYPVATYLFCLIVMDGVVDDAMSWRKANAIVNFYKYLLFALDIENAASIARNRARWAREGLVRLNKFQDLLNRWWRVGEAEEFGDLTVKSDVLVNAVGSYEAGVVVESRTAIGEPKPLSPTIFSKCDQILHKPMNQAVSDFEAEIHSRRLNVKYALSKEANLRMVEESVCSLAAAVAPLATENVHAQAKHMKRSL